MKNRIFVIILSLLLIQPVAVWSEDELVAVEDQAPVVEELVKEVAEENIATDSQYKQPNSSRKLIRKFLAAMGSVAISSFAIYIMLTVYNRIRGNFINQSQVCDNDNLLNTPEDLEEAVKIFIDKTDWK